MAAVDLGAVARQVDFAGLVGISQARVSVLVSEGVLVEGGTVGQWILAYCDNLREAAAGRAQSLMAERAALARAQRIGQEVKNRVAQGEYGPIIILQDALAAAGAAVADRFDALLPEVRKRCPELPEEARAAIETVVASARNEWVRSTSSLMAQVIDEITEDEPDDTDQAPEPAPGEEEVDAS